MNPIDSEFFEPAPPPRVKLRRRIARGAVVVMAVLIVGAAMGRALWVEANLPW